MGVTRQELLALRQKAAEQASNRMLDMLLGYSPAEKLSVADVKFIAEWTRTVSFDAMNEVEAATAGGPS